jgi:hypothetical protein
VDTIIYLRYIINQSSFNLSIQYLKKTFKAMFVKIPSSYIIKAKYTKVKFLTPWYISFILVSIF